MALPSYMSRREGRYYLQIRLARPLGSLIGRNFYRVSLRTADYRQARLRLGECIGWLNRMNDSIDYQSLFEKNVIELRTYLADRFPISQERLVARQHYEELLKNLSRRAKAVGCDPDMIEPEYQALFKHFVLQNVEADAWLRKMENARHYERGRADMQFLAGELAIPSSFQAASSFSQPQDLNSQTSPASQTRIPGTVPSPARNQDTHVAEFGTAVVTSIQSRASAKTKDEGSTAEIGNIKFSDALNIYVREDAGNADARSIVQFIVQFVIDMLDNPTMAEFHGPVVERFDRMIPDIPNRKNIPRSQTTSLASRYRYAQTHGWENLQRLTESRIGNNYHDALARFFSWAIHRGLYPHAQPVFSHLSPENLVSIQRDAFRAEEVLRIFNQPLFTGCKSPSRIWVAGDMLLQDHLYWGYVLSFLTGVRAGEIGQIELDDIQEDGGIYYLHLRGFDPSKGRVARKDVKRFKTASAHRIIPLHPLVTDLGLLDRIEDLRRIRCPVLFPEWEPYPKPGGELRWGQPLTKSFQYLKKKASLERFDTALYSARHWFADLLDSTDVKHVTRMRVMGHSSGKDTPSRYGSKTRLTTRDLAEITNAQMPELVSVGELLLAARRKADSSEMTLIKPWLLASNWSEHYRTKLLGTTP